MQSEPRVLLSCRNNVVERIQIHHLQASPKGLQEEVGVTEDEIVGWHHWLNVHEFEQTAGYGEGQGSLACHSSWGCRVGHD